MELENPIIYGLETQVNLNKTKLKFVFRNNYVYCFHFENTSFTIDTQLITKKNKFSNLKIISKIYYNCFNPFRNGSTIECFLCWRTIPF